MHSRKMWSKRALAGALSLLLLLLLLAGCATESEDIPTGPAITVDRLISDGWTAYAQGEYDQALTNFSDAANAEANNLEAYLGMGYTFAQQREFSRAIQNLGNVIALGAVLVADEFITPEYYTTLKVEASAGKAATYLGDRAYDDAVAWADSVIEEDPEFAHRWIDDFGILEVKRIQAEAYYGAEEYAECMFVVDELTGSFISGSTQIVNTTETIAVTILADTPASGVAELHLSTPNLIYPSSVTDAGGVSCEVVSYETGGSTITFRANPVPVFGDQYDVQYLYATDFGEFLIELRDALDSL